MATVHFYDSSSMAYKQAFEIFLKHTDQKKKMSEWLKAQLNSLPIKQHFTDAGAGEGQVTCQFAPLFQTTAAIEPNPFLCTKLKATMQPIVAANKSLQVIEKVIMDAEPSGLSNFILCSHVFYYIPQTQWLDNLQKLVSWLAPTSQLVVVLQDTQTDCMRMLQHFSGRCFDLAALTESFKEVAGPAYEVSLRKDDANIEVTGLESAYKIAEFILNVVPDQTPPTQNALENYVNAHFLTKKNNYKMSCHQNYLSILRKAG